jgi:hypothetical protein
MSTLRLTTISNQTGSASVPSDTVINGSAKAWVNFNGTGTVAIRAVLMCRVLRIMVRGSIRLISARLLLMQIMRLLVHRYTTNPGLPAFTNATRAIAAFSNTASSCRIQLYRSDTNSFDADSPEMNVAVFR